MFRKFLPRSSDFFRLFEELADNAVEAAALFKRIAAAGAVDDESLTKMRAIEHRGDEITYTLIDKLNKTFITPFDREDIHSLTKETDDVIDVINTMVGKLRLYRLSGVNPNLVEFSNLIDDSVRCLAGAVKGLGNMKNAKALLAVCVDINLMEDKGDTMRDKAIAELFDTEKDPIAVIKWKEVYEDAETVLDICEDVANVVEAIIVKQA
jgi:predicted phosphate transport protein (TIGR00153 family)